jgi:hypothetical protein
MRRTYAFFISLQLFLIINLSRVYAQDTIMVSLKIKVGLDVSGPAIYFTGKNNLSTEAYVSYDLNEKTSAALNAGYVRFNYSQYNYKYVTNGIFVRSGVDVNLLKPKKSLGKYWVGVGLRYGLSRFSSEFPSFQQDNYFGTISSSIGKRTDWVHFFEVSPGVRSEIFKNFSMGWSISVRLLLYSTSGKDLKPIFVPGFGNSAKMLSTGMNYFIAWNFPYKKKQVIIRKEIPEETEDTGTTGTSGIRQQASGIRQ